MEVNNVTDLRQLAKTSIPESKVVVKDDKGQRYYIAWCSESTKEGAIKSELTLLIEPIIG